MFFAVCEKQKGIKGVFFIDHRFFLVLIEGLGRAKKSTNTHPSKPLPNAGSFLFFASGEIMVSEKQKLKDLSVLCGKTNNVIDPNNPVNPV